MVSEGLAACKAEACQVAEVSVEETDEVGTMDPAAGEAGIMDLEVGLGDLVEAPEVDLTPAVVMAPEEVMDQGGDAVALVLAEAADLAGEEAEATSRCSSSLIQYFR